MSIILLIIVIVLVLVAYIYHRIKEINLQQEENDSAISKLRKSKFQWVVIIRTKDKFYKSFEDDDLGKVGYHIYTEHIKSINHTDIFIIDNKENEFLKIENGSESESMIGVRHPEQGHIGYLSFDIVNKIY
ncbi:MAG: hypothetical protein V4546_12030 [Bacteroidota bacterium]